MTYSLQAFYGLSADDGKIPLFRGQRQLAGIVPADEVSYAPCGM
jgi:hypothetical protein